MTSQMRRSSSRVHGDIDDNNNNNNSNSHSSRQRICEQIDIDSNDLLTLCENDVARRGACWIFYSIFLFR